MIIQTNLSTKNQETAQCLAFFFFFYLISNIVPFLISEWLWSPTTKAKYGKRISLGFLNKLPQQEPHVRNLIVHTFLVALNTPRLKMNCILDILYHVAFWWVKLSTESTQQVPIYELANFLMLSIFYEQTIIVSK